MNIEPKERVEKRIEDLYAKHSAGVQIRVIHIPKIIDAAWQAYNDAKDIEPAIFAAIHYYKS